MVYNDVYILDLHHFNWIKIIVFDGDPLRRAEHCSVINSHHLLIFGGTNTERYVGSDTFVIDLDYFENKKKRIEFNNTSTYNLEMLTRLRTKDKLNRNQKMADEHRKLELERITSEAAKIVKKKISKNNQDNNDSSVKESFLKSSFKIKLAAAWYQPRSLWPSSPMVNKATNKIRIKWGSQWWVKAPLICAISAS